MSHIEHCSYNSQLFTFICVRARLENVSTFFGFFNDLRSNTSIVLSFFFSYEISHTYLTCLPYNLMTLAYVHFSQSGQIRILYLFTDLCIINVLSLLPLFMAVPLTYTLI